MRIRTFGVYGGKFKISTRKGGVRGTRRYAKRRRRSAGQGAKRLPADFIIGSHAMVYSDRFMTLDPKRYARDFPELKLT